MIYYIPGLLEAQSCYECSTDDVTTWGQALLSGLAGATNRQSFQPKQHADCGDDTKVKALDSATYQMPCDGGVCQVRVNIKVTTTVPRGIRSIPNNTVSLLKAFALNHHKPMDPFMQ